MKKVSMLCFSALFMGVISCGNAEKKQQELDATLDKIEAIEQEIDQTNQELDQKAEEVESALNALDSL